MLSYVSVSSPGARAGVCWVQGADGQVHIIRGKVHGSIALTHALDHVFLPEHRIQFHSLALVVTRQSITESLHLGRQPAWRLQVRFLDSNKLFVRKLLLDVALDLRESDLVLTVTSRALMLQS